MTDLTALADRIFSEAYIADRPGQMGRLEAIADELADAEAIIRADERERVARDEVQIYARAWDEISDEVFEKVNDYDRMKHTLADLRAKVEGLRHEDECDVSRGRERPETGMAECNCLRSDVLALFEEASE